MLSGTSRVTWRGRVLFHSFGFLICVSMASAQQPSGSQSNPADAPPPAVTVPGIPAAQAAVGTTPTNPNPQTSDEKKDDQISMVKLGPGDLIEIGVYNVPELTTKARVSNSG